MVATRSQSVTIFKPPKSQHSSIQLKATRCDFSGTMKPHGLHRPDNEERRRQFELIWQKVLIHNGYVELESYQEDEDSSCDSIEGSDGLKEDLELCCPFTGSFMYEKAHTNPHSNQVTYHQEAWMVKLKYWPVGMRNRLVEKMKWTNRLPLYYLWHGGFEPQKGEYILVPTFQCLFHLIKHLETGMNKVEKSKEVNFSTFDMKSLFEEVGTILEVESIGKEIPLYRYQMLILDREAGVMCRKNGTKEQYIRTEPMTFPATYEEGKVLPTPLLPICLIDSIMIAWTTLSILKKKQGEKKKGSKRTTKNWFSWDPILDALIEITDYILGIGEWISESLCDQFVAKNESRCLLLSDKAESDHPSHFRVIPRPNDLLDFGLPEEVEDPNASNRFITAAAFQERIDAEHMSIASLPSSTESTTLPLTGTSETDTPNTSPEEYYNSSIELSQEEDQGCEDEATLLAMIKCRMAQRLQVNEEEVIQTVSKLNSRGKNLSSLELRNLRIDGVEEISKKLSGSDEQERHDEELLKDLGVPRDVLLNEYISDLDSGKDPAVPSIL